MSQRKLLATLVVVVPTAILSIAALLIPHDPSRLQRALSANTSVGTALVIGAAFWSRYWVFMVALLILVAFLLAEVLRMLRVP